MHILESLSPWLLQLTILNGGFNRIQKKSSDQISQEDSDPWIPVQGKRSPNETITSITGKRQRINHSRAMGGRFSHFRVFLFIIKFEYTNYPLNICLKST